MLGSIRPEYQTLSTRVSNDDHSALPHHNTTQHTTQHTTQEIQDRGPHLPYRNGGFCKIDAFDITDLSRSQTAREGEQRDIQFVQCLRGLGDGEQDPCRPSVVAFCLQSLKKHPALSCVEVISNAFSPSTSAPVDLTRRLETRCSVLGSPYLKNTIWPLCVVMHY